MGSVFPTFDALLLDVDGVLFSSGENIPGSDEALRLFAKFHIPIVFVTNNVNYSKTAIVSRVHSMAPGLEIRVIDPLDVLQEIILPASCHSEHVLAIGTATLNNRLRCMGLSLVGPESPHDPSMVIIGSSVNWDFKMLAAASWAVTNGAALYATGGERVFMWKGRLWPSSGAILAAVEVAAACKGSILGKPSEQILQLSVQKLPLGARILMIGDDIDVDILGARRAGYSCALVLTGVTRVASEEKWDYIPDWIAADLRSLAYQWWSTL